MTRSDLVATLVGLLLGGLLGSLYPEINGFAQMPGELRLTLAVKFGLIFGSLGWLLSRYHAARQRILRRLGR